MFDHWFFWAFVLFFFIHQFWETALTQLNIKYTEKHRDQIPDYFRDKIDPEGYQKSIDYNLEKMKFGLWVRWLEVPIVWLVILSGAFALVPFSHSVAYCAVVGLLLLLLQIPTSLYSQFVIEEKYGFNKMTAKTFIADLVKMLLLSALLGVPLLYLIFWLYAKAGNLWWLWAFGAFFGFEFLIAAVYPTLLAPLFNKFTPLEEGGLKESILALAKKIRFKLSGIFTIDGSKRSSHSNAYFSGIGRLRRIVLFDTLREQMENDEILAVLGHEMGHNKKRHVQKGLILSFVMTLGAFWLLSLAVAWEPFYATFGAGTPAPHKAFVLFSLFASHFSFWLTPFGNWLSRKYEYEADLFSKEVTGQPEKMVSSLVKLSKENLANLTPHPWYSFYHYSHPTTLERIRALES